MRDYNFKKYYSKKHDIKTFGLVVPLLNGAIDFIGEDGKQYNTDKNDLVFVEEE